MGKTDSAKNQTAAKEAALLAEALRAAVSQFVRAVRENSGTGSNAQSETLVALERSGPASIASLAASRCVTHQTMRLIIMKMVEHGLLELVRDNLDGRAYRVCLTAAGRANLERERASRTKWLARQLTLETSQDERTLLKEAAHILEKLSRGNSLDNAP